MTLFFTSDTHFGHANVIRTCNRPFADADEMDEAMIARWNERVQPGDTVYHLGDFCYRNTKAADRYLKRLHGKIHLIAGNHDTETIARHEPLFASVAPMADLEVDGQWLHLCHYPMREWNKAWRGAWHLFGHVHGRLDHEPHGYSLDVGVDSHDFRPWTLEEIAQALSKRANRFDSPRRSDKNNLTSL